MHIDFVALVPVAPPVVGLGFFVALRLRLRRLAPSWPVVRDVAFVIGVLCLVAALDSPIASHDEQFAAHAVQHLLLAMAAPLAFALAAPVTLVLRASTGSARRAVAAALRTPVVRALSWAPTGAAVSTAGMWLLYVTPLYGSTATHPLVHWLVHAHMLLAGSLLSFSLAGADPIGSGCR